MPLQLQCNTHRQLVLSAASFRPTRKMARGKLEKASDGKRGAGRAYVKAGQTGQQLVGRTVWNAIKSHRHAISGVRRPGRIKDSAGTTSTTTRTHHSRPKRKRAVGKALKALKGFSYPLKNSHALEQEGTTHKSWNGNPAWRGWKYPQRSIGGWDYLYSKITTREAGIFIDKLEWTHFKPFMHDINAHLKRINICSPFKIYNFYIKHHLKTYSESSPFISKSSAYYHSFRTKPFFS